MPFECDKCKKEFDHSELIIKDDNIVCKKCVDRSETEIFIAKVGIDIVREFLLEINLIELMDLALTTEDLELPSMGHRLRNLTKEESKENDENK